MRFCNYIQKATALMLVLALLCVLPACQKEQEAANAAVQETAAEEAAETLTPETVTEETAAILLETVTEPSVNSAGGEWSVIGLSRWDGEVPEDWFAGYYERVEAYAESCGGVLHDKKYTEYSRVILALTAIGKDPTNVAGYDLTMPLADFDKTVWQGNNGAFWALIALDSGEWELPQNAEAAVQADRAMYLQDILDHQQEDGGWVMVGANNGAPSDADITCMALMALAKYQSQPAVQNAVGKALEFLSQQQSAFSTAETNAQLIVALCELGISVEDERFVKDGKTAVDELLTYYRQGEGFCHEKDSEGMDLMATEQAFYALVAWDRAEQGLTSLYNMTDVK